MQDYTVGATAFNNGFPFDSDVLKDDIALANAFSQKEIPGDGDVLQGDTAHIDSHIAPDGFGTGGRTIGAGFVVGNGGYFRLLRLFVQSSHRPVQGDHGFGP